MGSLLTGKLPHQNKITANRARYRMRTKHSLPNLLKQAGYATFMGGRFFEENRYAMGFTAPKWKREDSFGRRNQSDLMDFLDAQADKRPFFIWWAPKLPSAPFNAPAEFVQLFEEAHIRTPKGLTGSRSDYVENELAQLAMEAWMDSELGKLKNKIESLGQLDNTLFCFLSDNGTSNHRPSVGSVFEKGLTTPLLFHLKDRIQPGLRFDGPTFSIHIYLTLLDYAEVHPPVEVPGRSLRPLLVGRVEPAEVEAQALFGAGFRSPRPTGRHTTEMDLFAVYMREPRWKYVLYVRNVTKENTSIMAPVGLFPLRRVGTEELFDLRADPGETQSLNGAGPAKERLRRMRAEATDWWYSTGGQKNNTLKR